ncbi:hypothetical protein [Pseudomonas mediterranea]|uniref:Peptidase C80 domain-containing protein n=1 Tax=Pseudomonas mediterranea TaxID=183795 RepID=A0AAX2DEA8_9PSED|nr:hypothetical protein [Pseudomonas mediterranea]SDU61328.1 hypothetical protein SAMN05216476_3641 [Pseudomonas mediterranea]
MNRNIIVIHPFETEEDTQFSDTKKNWNNARTAKRKILYEEIRKEIQIEEKEPADSDSDDEPSLKHKKRQLHNQITEQNIKKVKIDSSERINSIKNHYTDYRFINGSDIKSTNQRIRTKAESTISSAASSFDTIYILGHCSIGEDSISSIDNDSRITAKELADFLKEAGLKTSYAGKIKIYGCYSGLGISAESKSFAKRFSEEMKILMFHNCRVQGYTTYVGNYFKGHKIAFTGNEKELDQFQKLDSTIMKTHDFERRQLLEKKLDKGLKKISTRSSNKIVDV